MTETIDNETEDIFEEIEKHNQEILDQVKKEKGEEWFQELLILIEDAQVDNDFFEIVKKPSGIKQPSSKLLEYEWIDDQGLMPDGYSYVGTITVKIKEGKYLEMQYSHFNDDPEVTYDHELDI